MRRLIPAAAVVLLTAACSSSPAHTAAPAAPQPSSPAASRPATAPTPTATAAANRPAGAGNVSTAVGARRLSPGPFQVTPVHCGPYTAAEKAKFGTTAKGGLVFKYVNMSQSVDSAPSLSVNFLTGSTVAGTNVAAGPVKIGPGQSAEATVDALGDTGQDLAFTSCEMQSYGLEGAPAAGSYAP